MLTKTSQKCPATHLLLCSPLREFHAHLGIGLSFLALIAITTAKDAHLMVLHVILAGLGTNPTCLHPQSKKDHTYLGLFSQ